MAARAVWKGRLSLNGVDCPVVLYAAVSASARLRFHILNRKTEHRVVRSYVDAGTGKPVESAELLRGYDTGEGEFVTLTPEDIAGALPQSDKTLEVLHFIRCDDIDRLYFDRPYFLTPASAAAIPLFAAIRDGMRAQNAAMVARSVLFRRLRSVLIRAHGKGLHATLLNFDYEVRSPGKAFAEIPEVEIRGEMLDLAQEIIRRMAGRFDPAAFADRYEEALAELVRAKAEGRKPAISKARRPAPTTDLMEALRGSLVS